MTDEAAIEPATEAPAAPAPRHRQVRRGRPPGARHRLQRKSAAQEEETLQRGGDEVRLKRTRSRRKDPMYIDPKIIPKGVSYEWKRLSAYGMPDPDHQTDLRENHWRPVPAQRHPFLAHDLKKSTIERSGCLLMERPFYLTEEARQEDWETAMEQVERKMKSLTETPEGTMTREHESVQKVTRLGRTYEPLKIPEE